MASGAAKIERESTKGRPQTGADLIYLCYGEDEFTKAEFVDGLVSARLKPEEMSMNLAVFPGKGLQAAVVRAAVETYPFFGEHRVTVIHSAFEMAEADQTLLAGFCEKEFPEHSTLILVSAAVDRRRKLYAAVSRVGVVREFKPLQGAEQKEWLRGRLKVRGMSVSREAGEYLLERDGGDLRGLENDLEKIGLRWLGANRMLSLGDIKDLVGGVPEADVFRLLDQVSKRQRGPAIEALRAGFAAGQEPMLVLSMIARQFRTMLFCKALAARGASVDDIASAAKIHRYSAQLCQSHSRNFTEVELVEALVRLADLDLGVKTGRDDASGGLEVFVVAVTRDSRA